MHFVSFRHRSTVWRGRLGALLLCVFVAAAGFSADEEGPSVSERVGWLRRAPEAEGGELPCLPVRGWEDRHTDTQWWLILRITSGYGSRLGWLAMRETRDGRREGTAITLEAEEPLYVYGLDSAEGCSAFIQHPGPLSASTGGEAAGVRLRVMDISELNPRRLERFLRRLERWRIAAMGGGQIWLDVPGLRYHFVNDGCLLDLSKAAPAGSPEGKIVEKFWKLLFPDAQ